MLPVQPILLLPVPTACQLQGAGLPAERCHARRLPSWACQASPEQKPQEPSPAAKQSADEVSWWHCRLSACIAGANACALRCFATDRQPAPARSSFLEALAVAYIIWDVSCLLRQDFEGLTPEEDDTVPGSYEDALNGNTKLGKAVRAACAELEHLNDLVSGHQCNPWPCHFPTPCIILPAIHTTHCIITARPMMKHAAVRNAVAELGACSAGMNLPSEPTFRRCITALGFGMRSWCSISCCLRPLIFKLCMHGHCICSCCIAHMLCACFCSIEKPGPSVF